MLTILAEFKTFFVSKQTIAEKFDRTVKDEVVCLLYHSALEFVAALNGEIYDRSVVEQVLESLGGPCTLHSTFERQPRLTFVCTDGDYESDYDSAMLSRHFLFIRGWLEEYPNETRLPFTHDVLTTMTALDVVLEQTRNGQGSSCQLTDEVLYAMQTLTPVTDMYYLLSDLSPRPPSDVEQFIRGVSETERKEVLLTHERTMHIQRIRWGEGSNHPRCLLTLPERGEGLALAFAFPSVLKYMARQGLPAVEQAYPSTAFLNRVLFSLNEGDEARVMQGLATTDFSDYHVSGPLDGTLRHAIVKYVLEHLSIVSLAQCEKILALFGIRHSKLKNMEVEGCAPYQITIRESSIIRTTSYSLRRALVDYHGLSEIDVEEVFRPYCSDVTAREA